MGITRRRFASLAGATAAAGLLSTRTGRAGAQDDRPILRVGMNVEDRANLDPHYAIITPDRMVADMVCNALIRYVPGNMAIFEPDLALDLPSSSINDNGTQTWTFELRDDVMVQGTAASGPYLFTAEDAVFSFTKVANPDTSAFSQGYTNWEFEAIDEQTFQITLPQPVSENLFFPLVANYQGGIIVCKGPYEALGANAFSSSPAGTGPFRFESHAPQNNMLLRANDDYFRGAPLLAGVEIRFISDSTSRELALQANNIDVAFGLPEASWVDRMNAMDGYQADVFGWGDGVFVSLDVEHEILQDPLVREAIFYAMSREGHAALSGEPVSELMFSPIAAGTTPGGLTEDDARAAGLVLDQDIDKAMELLAEAGYPDGFELSLVTSEYEIYRMNYEVLAEELRQVNIEVTLEVVQHPVMHELIRQGRNAIVIYNGTRPTADTFLTHFFTSDAGPANFSNYNVDELRDRARAELDEEEQIRLWKEANVQLMENFAGTGFYFVNNVYSRSTRVDYGHELIATVQNYPVFTEKTSITPA
jgi:peptide/nickel transport system substrate-binding protein